MKQLPHFNSIRKKVIFLDLIFVFPLFVLFCILMSYVFEDSNYKLNNSKLSLLEEKCSNIANRNTEIIKISVGMYLDQNINRLISKKNKLTGYEYISAQDSIQSKMLELTELFPDRQYQVMLLCENGMNFFQSSLNFTQDMITLKMLDQESWYQEAMEKDDSVYFLPKYRSPALQKLFREDTLFAVQKMRNLNSGRNVGIMIVAISRDIWGNVILSDEDSDVNTMVIDQYRKIIFSSDPQMYGYEVENNSYYDQIANYSKGFFLGNVKKQYCHIRFASIEGVGWKLISYEPYQHGWSSFYVILFLVLGAAMFSVLVIIVFYNCSFISRRMEKLNKNILEVSNGDLKTRIQEDYEAEFHEICHNFNYMLDHIENLMKQLEKEEEEKHALEIQALQAQINPHFFHNTLVTIRFMIQMEEYNEADRALLAFSKLLRKSFVNSQKIIPIREELDIVEDYLELMKLRYRDKFQWKILAAEDVMELGILKNVIQPLVENSISHGFNMKDDMGHIVICAYRIKESVIIEVEDDGVGVDLEKINNSIHNQQTVKARDQLNGIGLSNIQMRILRNFGSQYGLSVEVNSSGGVTFRMNIPVIQMEGGNS